MVYALLADRLEARTLADRQVAAVLAASGGEVQMPDPDEARTAFDEALNSEPRQVDTAHERLLRGLGLRGR